jgi:hypothetical protein
MGNPLSGGYIEYPISNDEADGPKFPFPLLLSAWSSDPKPGNDAVSQVIPNPATDAVLKPAMVWLFDLDCDVR